MLEELLAIPFALQLSLAQPNLPSEQYIFQQQKPAPVYAQASKEDLSDNLKERSIKKIGDMYKKLIIEGNASKKTIEDAKNFYGNVIKNHSKNPYVPEAYLNLGRIICCVQEPKDFYGGMQILKKAYETSTNINIKVDALLLLGFLHRDNSSLDSRFNLKEAKEYFQKIIELVPSSDIAIESKRLIKEIEEYKQKTK